MLEQIATRDASVTQLWSTSARPQNRMLLSRSGRDRCSRASSRESQPDSAKSFTTSFYSRIRGARGYHCGNNSGAWLLSDLLSTRRTPKRHTSQGGRGNLWRIRDRTQEQQHRDVRKYRESVRPRPRLEKKRQDWRVDLCPPVRREPGTRSRSRRRARDTQFLPKAAPRQAFPKRTAVPRVRLPLPPDRVLEPLRVILFLDTLLWVGHPNRERVDMKGTRRAKGS